MNAYQLKQAREIFEIANRLMSAHVPEMYSRNVTKELRKSIQEINAEIDKVESIGRCCYDKQVNGGK